MQKVLLPFFIIRLCASLIPFALEGFLLAIQPYFGLVFFVILMSLYLVSFVTTLEKNALLNKKITLSKTFEQSPTELKISEIQQKLFKRHQVVLYQDDPKVNVISNQLLELNKKHPYHRDILLNLAIIEVEKNNIPAAQSYLQQVDYSDPNNSELK